MLVWLVVVLALLDEVMVLGHKVVAPLKVLLPLPY